jgi:dihydrofolate synthase/folylpolyglutamate synthase
MDNTALMENLFLKRGRLTPKDRKQLLADLESLGHPQYDYPTVHIAGTNGKGSVATKIAKTLEYVGYRVGLFTSPHIQNFEERIQINGVQISEDAIQKLLPLLLEQLSGYGFFDYTTFLAFQYFSLQKVDVAVFEAGIGGLHDTTNVVEPLVSVITSVAFDHLELLGSTIDAIAFQKAGIIKPGVPVVIGPKACFKPVFDQATMLQSPLTEVALQQGDYDTENQAIARAAIQKLEPFFSIPLEAVERGVSQKPPCRFERCGRFVMDVAHNVEGFESLLKAWDIHHPEQKFVTVIGLSFDKDVEACLQIMATKTEHLFLVSADSTRAVPLSKLEDILKRAGICNFTACASVEQAIQEALASDHDILVCGSFYIMKQAREQIFRLQVS